MSSWKEELNINERILIFQFFFLFKDWFMLLVWVKCFNLYFFNVNKGLIYYMHLSLCVKYIIFSLSFEILKKKKKKLRTFL